MAARAVPPDRRSCVPDRADGALGLYLRTRQLNAGFWIDEGLSVGIAHHHWSSIPGLLRQDGSPPGYYLLLGLWIRLFGDGERATHTLSLLFGLACIPLAYAAGARDLRPQDRPGLRDARGVRPVPHLLRAGDADVRGRGAALDRRRLRATSRASCAAARAGRSCSCPRSPRWSTCTTGRSSSASGSRRRRSLCARRRLKRLRARRGRRRAALPALGADRSLSQVRHTGAPWSTSPGFRDLVLAPGAVVNGDAALVALVLVGGAGLLALAAAPGRRRARGRARARDRDRRDRVSLGLALVAGLARVDDALLRRRARPGAAGRRARARAGRAARARRARGDPVPLGGLLGARRQGERAPDHGAACRGFMHPGRARRLDPSRAGAGAPLLPRPAAIAGRRRSGRCPTPGSSTGAMPSTGCGRRTRRPRVDQTIAAVRPGAEFVVVTPVFRDYRAWNATWTHLVWEKSTAYTSALAARSARPPASTTSSTDEIALQPQLLQADAGVRLSPSRLDFAVAAPWRGRSHDA